MRPRHNDNPGFALIAVLVALSILLALVTPFLAAMLNEADISSNVVAQAQIDHENEGQRDMLLHLASMTDQANDPTRFFDSKAEFPKRLDLPAAFRSGGLRKLSLIHSGEVWDLQGRVQINTASPLLIANLLSLSASLSQRTGGCRLPDVEGR